MTLKVRNPRWTIKRSSIPGTIPTVPGTGATSTTDYTLGGWLSTDLLVGEFFANIKDDKLWYRTEGGIVLLNSGTGATISTFTDLSDVPTTYSGRSGYSVIVNASENGLIFANPTGKTYSLLQLTDCPSSYGTSGQTLVVNPSGTGMVFSGVNNSFINLTDVTGPWGKPDEILKVSGTGNKLEFAVGKTLFVDLTNQQLGIAGEKHFIDLNAASFSATSFTINNIASPITSINTNEYTLSAATDTELISSLAVKNFVTNSIANSAGITGYTGDWVTVDTDQTITGEKTFANIIGGDASFENFNANGNINVDLTSYQYWGSESVNGSFRISISASTDLVVEKRVGGVWITKGSF